MGIPNLKKDLVSSIAFAVANVDPLKGEKIIFVTPSGIIQGFPRQDIDSDLSDCVFSDVALSASARVFSEKYFSKYNLVDVPLDGNDGYICLADVDLSSSSGQNIHFPELIVFFDQIIGVAFGTFQSHF